MPTDQFFSTVSVSGVSRTSLLRYNLNHFKIKGGCH